MYSMFQFLLMPDDYEIVLTYSIQVVAKVIFSPCSMPASGFQWSPCAQRTPIFQVFGTKRKAEEEDDWAMEMEDQTQVREWNMWNQLGLGLSQIFVFD